MLAAVAVATLVGSIGVAQEPPPADTLFATLESALAELPKDHLDVEAALASMAGGENGAVDADTVFAWVRDETGYVPYRGALRGPAGVLMDRIGNALDRATLLRALLHAAGYETVMVHGTLDEATLERAAGAIRLPADPRAARAQPSAQFLAERAADTLGMDAAVVTERLAMVETDRAALERAVALATERQSQALAELLPAVEGGAAAPGAADLADHWWVQVAVDGAWIDLDPTLPDAVPGDTLTAATLRFDLTNLRQLAAVDGACRDLSCGDRLHRVTIRAVAETWDGESLTEHELLATEMLAAEGFGRRIGFATLPVDWPEDLDLFGITEPLEALRDALVATTAWDPVLTIGETRIEGLRIEVDGTIADKPAGGNAGAAGGLGGGIGGMFGGFGGGGDSEGALTALWLEFDVVTPGRGTRRERREVFDIVGASVRRDGTEAAVDDAAAYVRAVALGGETEILVTPAALTPDAVAFSSASRLLAQREAWTALYENRATADPTEIRDRLNDMANLLGPLEWFAQQRAALSPGYLDGALVAAYHRGFDASLAVVGAFDLVHVPSAILADSAVASDAQGRQHRIEQGVRDTVLEAELQRRGPISDPTAAPTGPAAVAEAFARDLAAGRPWRLVRDAGELAAVAPGLDPDLTARVLADLDAGMLAVVPEGGADAVGWWRFDPATGATLGMGDRGWGQAMTEYNEITSVVLQLRAVINQYAAMAQCLGIAVTMPLRGATGIETELAECMFNLVCGQLNSMLNMALVTDTGWTTVILSATIDALWGGVPEAKFGGFCGALWKRVKG
ncbi:MAG: transglutaminase domain-containing protein [Trueperaceae bacterium]